MHDSCQNMALRGTSSPKNDRQRRTFAPGEVFPFSSIQTPWTKAHVCYVSTLLVPHTAPDPHFPCATDTSNEPPSTTSSSSSSSSSSNVPSLGWNSVTASDGQPTAPSSTSSSSISSSSSCRRGSSVPSLEWSSVASSNGGQSAAAPYSGSGSRDDESVSPVNGMSNDMVRSLWRELDGLRCEVRVR